MLRKFVVNMKAGLSVVATLGLVPLAIILALVAVFCAYLAYVYGFSMVVGVILIGIALVFGGADALNWKKPALYLLIAGVVIIFVSGYGYGFQTLNFQVKQLLRGAFG